MDKEDAIYIYYMCVCVYIYIYIYIYNGIQIWQPTPVLLSGKFHGLRSLVGYSSWVCNESDTTEQLHFIYIYTHTGILGHKNSGIMSFAVIILSEVSHKQKNKYHMISHMLTVKYNTKELIYETEANVQIERTYL